MGGLFRVRGGVACARTRAVRFFWNMVILEFSNSCHIATASWMLQNSVEISVRFGLRPGEFSLFVGASKP